MTWRASGWNAKLPGIQYLTNLTSQKNFAAVDFPHASALSDSNAGIPPKARTSPRTLGGKSQCSCGDRLPPRRCDAASKHTSYFYNQFPAQLVKKYETRAFAQPAKDWRPTTSKTILGTYEILIGDGLVSGGWEGATNYKGWSLRMVPFGS